MAKTSKPTTTRHLPATDGKWVADRARNGELRGWFEMFADGDGRWFSIPDASRYVRAG